MRRKPASTRKGIRNEFSSTQKTKLSGYFGIGSQVRTVHPSALFRLLLFLPFNSWKSLQLQCGHSGSGVPGGKPFWNLARSAFSHAR